MSSVDILCFRRDLRTNDNPILSFDTPSLPIFIFDTDILSTLSRDDKRVSFIFDTVLSLKKQLKNIGLDLAIFYGSVDWVFEYISKYYTINTIYASSDEDTYSISRDTKIKQKFNLKILKDNFLLDKNIYNQEGGVYKVFTPYYKKVLPLLEQNIYTYKYVQKSLVPFEYDSIITQDGIKPLHISSINFNQVNINIPQVSDTLKSFITKVANYEQNRDFPSIDGSSKLGVHLRFGTVSIREVFDIFLNIQGGAVFVKELIWREFYNYIFYHFPHSKTQNFLNVNIKWDTNEEMLQKWQYGNTGIPIVDAGMRELLSTGHMHNRVRMIVASFLCKDLCIDWKEGEKWFAKHLFDYESCSNVGSWQWCASSGVDAMPYFRIFNPYLQAKKFDKDGEYITKWVKEYKNLTPKQLHNEEFLLSANLFAPYQQPMVNHKFASSKFVTIYKTI